MDSGLFRDCKLVNDGSRGIPPEEKLLRAAVERTRLPTSRARYRHHDPPSLFRPAGLQINSIPSSRATIPWGVPKLVFCVGGWGVGAAILCLAESAIR